MEVINWQPLDLTKIPTEPGVYAFKRGKRWLYIGQSCNIKQRLNSQHLPFQIALELSGVRFLYHLTDSRHKVERQLIKDLLPDWNGSTSWGMASERYLYAATGPHCQTDIDCFQQFRETLLNQMARFPERCLSLGLNAEMQNLLKAGDLTLLCY